MNIYIKAKLYLLLPALLFFGSCGESSNIHTVDTLDLLQAEVKTLSKDDLVIFDVDFTLIKAANAISFWDVAENKKVVAELFGPCSRLYQLGQKRRDYLDSIRYLQEKFVLVDEHAPELIKEMQKKGVKVIALTAQATGPYGKIKKLEDNRIDELNNVGIDFSSAFETEEPIFLYPKKISEENSLKAQTQSMVKNGIVFSTHYTKGAALECFLETTKWKPRRIIFIDDSKKRVENVAATCKKLGTPFMGLHYTGANKISKPIDRALAKFQVDYLIDHEEWLDDEKARALMPVVDSQIFTQPV